MWVEMFQTSGCTEPCSCHPLREDVSWNDILKLTICYNLCHPLREDVSWNAVHYTNAGYCNSVILFVRMWVEINHSVNSFYCFTSSSSWGCELKYQSGTARRGKLQSSSSWGCELKFFYLLWIIHRFFRHPLREDVSWNTCDVTSSNPADGHPLREDVSWNTSCSVGLLSE